MGFDYLLDLRVKEGLVFVRVLLRGGFWLGWFRLSGFWLGGFFEARDFILLLRHFPVIYGIQNRLGLDLGFFPDVAVELGVRFGSKPTSQIDGGKWEPGRPPIS